MKIEEKKIIPTIKEPPHEDHLLKISESLRRDIIVEKTRSLEIISDKIHNLTHELTDCNKKIYHGNLKEQQIYKLMRPVIVTDIEQDIDKFQKELLKLRNLVNNGIKV